MRCVEHQRDLRCRNDKSPLWKHCILEHSSQEAEFSMEVLSHHKSCLDRQVQESVRISRTEAEIILNSKSEFHQAPIVRVSATTGLQEEQEDRISPSSQEAGRGGRSHTRGRGGATQGPRGRGGVRSRRAEMGQTRNVV